MMVGGGGGWGDGISGAASGSFASTECASSGARFEFSKGMELVGMELQVETEDGTVDGIVDMVEVGVEVENEFAHFKLGTLVQVWLLRGLVDDGVGVGVSAGLTTTYDGIAVGEGNFVTS